MGFTRLYPTLKTSLISDTFQKSVVVFVSYRAAF